MSYIDLSDAAYSYLNQMAVYAQGALTATTTGSDPISVNDGYWAGLTITEDPVAAPVTGALQDPSGTYGLQNAAGFLLQCNTQLTALIDAIDATLSSLTPIPFTNVSENFPPGYYLGAGIDYTGQALAFDAQGDPNAQFFLIGTSFTFTDTTFELQNGARAGNIFLISIAPDGSGAITFTQDAATDMIVPCIMITNAFTATNSGTLPITFNGQIISQRPTATYGAITLTNSGSSSFTINLTNAPYEPPVPPEPPVVCYAKGTLILTKRGLIPIEMIKAGDKVLTNGKIYYNKIIKNENTKLEKVMWVSKFKVNKLNSSSRPICIKKNALAKNLPFKDLYVSPNHSIVIDGEMVLAKELVNEHTIYQDNACQDVEYYHLECEHHSTIFANGVLSESYLDLNNRTVFDNSVKIHPKIMKKSKLSKIADLK